MCSLADAESHESDERLIKMALLYEKFGRWSSGDIEGREAVKLARELWQTGETEGYVSERGQLAADVVHVAAAHSEYAISF